MPQKCPRCKLINPPNAQRCDCGYDFPSQTVKESYLGPQTDLALQSASGGEILICVVMPLVGLFLGLRARSRGRTQAGRNMLQLSIMVIVVAVAVELLRFFTE
jgi:hypothetical protein